MPSKKPQPTSGEPKSKAANKMPIMNKRPDFATYYASNTGILATKFDVSLTFGRIVDVQDDGRALVDQFAQVAMSYQHAKAVASILKKVIDRYEATSGPIPVYDEGEEISIPGGTNAPS